ncbi:pyrimidine utilization protein D [Pseudomonas huaxiensis]|uniref:pyrimidine utilization protein D n=1 Tax=Pseudomonas huaxiensis TaxID=2213017 RepID=UPI000DA6D14D|nr:pyrimidine utilization protein D [Pseudomonas huaxiensis]
MSTALHHEVHGPVDGSAVLLSSGLGGGAGYWSSLVPVLVAAGYKVIVYDQRGTGRSRQTLPEDYRIADMARDIRDVLDVTQTRDCHLVGHALGGLAGLQLALDFPERLRSLTLINAWAAPNPHSARCFDARLALLDAVGPRAYVEAQPIFLYPASWCAANAEQVQAEVEHSAAHFPGAATMKARIAALRRFDISDQLADIGVPTLVSVAKDDVLVPWTCSMTLAQRLPNARLHTAEHGGHAHNITAASEFNEQLLAFLDAQTKV